MLKDKVLPWVKKTMGNSILTLQQDGTTFHTAKTVQCRYKENFTVFLVKRVLALFLTRFKLDGLWSLIYGGAQSLCNFSYEY